MGFHRCEYCTDGIVETGSRDIFLDFDGGGRYQVPELILHYVAAHGYLPPDDFVNDVGHKTLTTGCDIRAARVKVGYLKGDFSKKRAPVNFFTKLWLAMRRAERLGRYEQTRGG